MKTLTILVLLASLLPSAAETTSRLAGMIRNNSGQPVAGLTLHFYKRNVSTFEHLTTFTAADFGRTFKSNGLGSDHAWGNHHMVVGGAVNGGTLKGSFPVFQLGGPSDTDNTNPTGRWIPTTSVDEYSATLARWMGVSESALDVIFPNLNRFPSRNLGFMS